MRNETLGNLSHLPAPVVELVRQALKGEAFVAASSAFAILSSRPHGHVQAVSTAMRRLGFAALIASRASRERDLVCAMVAARVLAPHTAFAGYARSLAGGLRVVQPPARSTRRWKRRRWMRGEPRPARWARARSSGAV